MRSRLTEFDPGDVECRKNPEMWFSELAMDIRDAIKICNSCPAREPCLEIGMENEYGIFGGLTPQKRDILRKRRNVNQYYGSQVS